VDCYENKKSDVVILGGKPEASFISLYTRQ
jgi:hypothetical protein